MTKKKILSIVLGVVICFNVCFSRPQRVEAVAGVDDATILIALYNALCGTVFLHNNSNSFSFTDIEFVDYYRLTHQNSDLYSYLIGQTAVANITGGICGGFLSKAFLKDFVQTANDFWSSYGEFTEEGYTYIPVSETSNLTVDQWKSKYLDYVEYYFPGHRSEAEPFFRSFQGMGIYGESHPYKMFYYFVTPSDCSLPGPNIRILGMACSADGFHDYPWEYRVQCWTYLNGNTLALFNRGIGSGTEFEPLSAVYVNNVAASSVSTDPVTVGLTSDGQDLASDPDDYADKVSSGLADTVVTHNSNGSVSVDDNIAFNIGVIEEVDDDGNVTYTPVIPDSASAAGFTLDDILSKPSEVEKYPTAVDDTSAQAISGTVSVTGFQRFGMQVISHLLTHTSWLEKIHNGIISIPSYMDILTAILDAIPSVIDYSEVLEGIKAGILGITIPNVFDYTEVLNGIKAGILGIAIPNVFDYTEVLNGIKAGILGIAIPNVLDYTEVLNGIKAGILGIAIPNIIDYTDVLNGIKTGILSGLSTLFIPDTTAFDGLTDIITDKFSIVFQLEELWDTLLGSDFGSSKVEFTITIPGWFLHSDSDKVCLLIDFSVFDDYRSFLHAVIILLSYLAFAKRLVDRIPTVLGYPGGGSDTVIVKE